MKHRAWHANSPKTHFFILFGPPSESVFSFAEKLFQPWKNPSKNLSSYIAHPWEAISAVKKSLKKSLKLHCSSLQGTCHAYCTRIAPLWPLNRPAYSSMMRLCSTMYLFGLVRLVHVHFLLSRLLKALPVLENSICLFLLVHHLMVLCIREEIVRDIWMPNPTGCATRKAQQEVMIGKA